MALNNDDLFLVNQGGVSKKLTYEKLKENINVGGNTGNDLQAVTDNGNTTTNGITFDGSVSINNLSSNSTLTIQGGASNPGGKIDFRGGTATGGNNLGFFTTTGSTSTERMRLNSVGNLNIGGNLTDTGSNISLKAGGSGEFANSITAGPAWSRSADQDTTWIPKGEIYLQRSSGNASQPILRGHLSSNNGSNSTVTTQILADGSASFASDVNVGNLSITNNSSGIELDNQGILNIQRADGASTAAIQIFSGADAAARCTIFPDGSAEFAGNITAPNVTFNLDDGSTLAVKDRVLNLISRLDALEANEVIDDAVDTSLLSLLASASARLDSIEARLAALEGGN